MKAIDLYFPVVLFIMLYKVTLNFRSVHGILKLTSQMKAIEQYFPVKLFIMLYKVVLTLHLNLLTIQMIAIDQHFPVVLFVVR